MYDLRFAQIAFGGVAIEPLSDEGAVFVMGLDAPFQSGDACLEGFPWGTVAIEGRDFAETRMLALDDYLTWEVGA
jgi:hypothetical protein